MECQSHLFSLPSDEHYLNCAYKGPLPRATEEAGIVGLRRKSTPARMQPSDFFSEPDALRQSIGGLINAPAEKVALVPAVSYGTALAALNVKLGAGDNVVMPGEEFPSNVYAWRENARRAGAELRMPPRPDERLFPARVWSERMLAAIDSRTRVVALSTVHWTDGTPFDLAPLRKRAADVGALFMLDGTQSIGAVPFDWEALNPDLLVCAGYKWLLGAYQLGFAVIGEALADWQPLEHNWIGREGSEDFTSLTRYRDGFAPGARRFDVGERSNPVSLPMLAESIRQIGQWGVENIAGYTEKLRELLRAELEETFGPCPPEDPPRGPWMYPGHQLSPHLFGVNLPAGQDPVRVAEELRRMKVHVSVRGSSVRVSPHVYNDQGNISALAAALRRACG